MFFFLQFKFFTTININLPVRVLVQPLAKRPRGAVATGVVVALAGLVHADELFAALIVEENEEGEAKTGQPVNEEQRAGAKGLVQTRDVHKRGTERSLEEEAKEHGAVAKPMGEQREHARLADEQIGPLHDNDADKVRGLRMGEGLHFIATGIVLRTGAVEAARVAVLVDEVAVLVTAAPQETLAGQVRGLKPVVGQDDEIAEEASECLHDTNLEVGEDNETAGHQTVRLGVTRGGGS